jgi:hypothetical protein
MAAPTVVSTTTPQTGAAATMAVNMPPTVAANQIIWVWMSMSGVVGAMPGSPAFTLKLTGDSNQVWAYIRGSDHIANGSPATYTFSTSGGTITRGMASCISGVIATGDPTDGTPAVGTTTTSASSAALAITTTVVDTLLLNYDTKSSSSTNLTSPTGLTLQTPAASVAHLFAGPQTAAGASGTKTSTYGTLTNHRSSLVALKPALVVGDLAGSTPAVTAALVGGLDGNVAGQTPAATAALVGTLPGDAAGTIPAAAAALAGVLPGDMAGQSAPATGTLVGGIVGVLDPSTPRTQAALDGTYTPPDFGSGALAAAIPAATADLAGDYLVPPGVLAGSIPAATVSLAGSLDGALAATAAKATGTLTGSYEEPNPGDLIAATPSLTAVLVGSLAGTLAGTTPKVTAHLTGRLNYEPRHHKATVREVLRTHTVGEVGRKHTIGEQSRKTTVTEGIG